jgi:spore germination cell wall hydrolase CwlJ-like protein
MIRILKAAPVAALSLTLLSAAAYTDAGLAFGAKAEAALEADTITIDPEMIAESEDARNSVSRIEPLSQNSQTPVFTPGTGGFIAPMPQTDVEDEAPKAETEKLTASSLAALVAKHGAPDALDAQTRCLAGAVYFESKGESLAGQLAVARVVIGRSKSGRFASSLCGVVFEKSQFSFVRGGRMPAIDTGSRNWRNAVAISQIALNDSWKSPVEGALFFHARYVSPGWKLKRLGSIDNHIFYR